MEMKVCHCNNARVTGGSQEELIVVELFKLEYASQEETKEYQGHSTLTLPVHYSVPSQGQLVQLAVLTR